MTRERAKKIATNFMNKFNPEMWNGVGKTPASFNSEQCEGYDIAENLEVLIDFEYDEEDEVWCHWVYVYSKNPYVQLSCMSGRGVNSIPNLVDTIMDIVKWEEDYE